jgi:molybdate transport system substrate-binding protein
MIRKITAALAAALVLGGAPAHAAALKVFVGGAMTETIEKIGAAYAKKSGNTMDYVSDTTGALQKRLAGGEKADVVVVTAAGMDQLAKEKRIDPASRTDLVRALIGVAVKKRTRSPDLTSADSLKAALLKAKSVSYVNPAAGGTSGTYFEGVLKKMGIYDRMKPKIVYRNQGSEVADAVAKGDAQIGISFIAELAPNKGVRIAGPLPKELQNPTNYVAAVLNGASDKATAQAYIKTMTSARGLAIFRKAGLEPLAGKH